MLCTARVSPASASLLATSCCSIDSCDCSESTVDVFSARDRSRSSTSLRAALSLLVSLARSDCDCCNDCSSCATRAVAADSFCCSEPVVESFIANCSLSCRACSAASACSRASSTSFFCMSRSCACFSAVTSASCDVTAERSAFSCTLLAPTAAVGRLRPPAAHEHIVVLLLYCCTRSFTSRSCASLMSAVADDEFCRAQV